MHDAYRETLEEGSVEPLLLISAYVLDSSERDSMFGLDSEWLLIWLDGSGRFERYEVWTD